MTALNRALQHFRAGRSQQAEDVCRQAIQDDPDNADALHLMGVLVHQSGRSGEAVELLRKAVALSPGQAEFHYNLGVALQVLNRLDEAAASYQESLRLQPGRAEAHNNLGFAQLLRGRRDEALACFEQALRLNPDYAEAHSNRGEVLRLQGKLAEAAVCLEQALRLQPDFAEVHVRLGRTASAQGDSERARRCFEEALRLEPNRADVHNDLGLIFLRQGQLDRAEDCFQKALHCAPADVDALNNRGVVLRERGRLDEADTCFHQALRLKPDHAGAHNNLGRVCEDRGRLAEAAARFRLALCYDPDNAALHNNLANVLTTLGKPDESLPHYRQAVRLQPVEPVFHNNLANTLTLLGKPDEAEACCRQALRLRPDYADAFHNLAITLAAQGDFEQALAQNAEALRLQPENPGARNCRALWWLQQGDFERGWPEYEWRWKIRGVSARSFRQPTWDGSSLAGRTILLYAEQALGDTLQFIRYAPLVKERGATVILECQTPLARLLAGSPGIDQLVPRGSPLPEFDVQAALLSLPGILRTTFATMPANVPYVFPDAGLVERWRSELSGDASFKIGIAWQGSTTFAGDRMRSLPLRHFAPLANVEGVRLFSLQKGPAREQIKDVARHFSVVDLGARLDETAGAFMDTAAVMKSLDLVVTSDTSIAHLAGALGVPVWVALSVGPDWRWLRDRADCPWYPTMRLFRQPRLHDWETVFENMAAELRQRTIPAPREAVAAVPSPAPRATLCLLTYGDHLPYFRRCLDSVLRYTPLEQVELRLGFNAAPASFDHARERLSPKEGTTDSAWLPGNVWRTSYRTQGGTVVRLWNSPVNLYKEPMARLMYHDIPLTTEYAIWLDDDSFVEDHWWQALCPLLDQHIDYIGQSWWVDYQPGQDEMVRAQPWCRGMPFESRDGRVGVWFMTGGFVVVRAERLREANFPDTDSPWKGDKLKQYGGDTLLGEIARQLGWTQAIHDAHVKVNVDLHGNHPAPRRGGTGRQYGSDIDQAIR
jgi:tetratricopeptide (TPR) repeat protein